MYQGDQLFLQYIIKTIFMAWYETIFMAWNCNFLQFLIVKDIQIDIQVIVKDVNKYEKLNVAVRTTELMKTFFWLFFWQEARLPFRYWEPSQESCPRTRNAHVTDQEGLAHGVTVFNSDQSQAFLKNLTNHGPLWGNFDQSQASTRNFD